ncbi:MAG: metal-dependent hydrolase [Pseudomonadales bacterium]|nr:metal-dependent hydrolase [Pseudomonadales bacterium]
MMPTRRNLKFHVPDDNVLKWHSWGPTVTQFFNTLSLFFPEGERFFINSVRKYRDQIEDPELQEAVRNFIGQEAMHGREHEDYNQKMVEAGLPVDKQEALVSRLLDFISKHLPNAMQLSATVALEHLTAILADVLLREPDLIEGSDEAYQQLWHWHALEETEHKAVAFDVFETVFGTGLKAWLLRSSGLVLATTTFFALFYPFYLINTWKVGHLFDLKGWWKSFKFQWLKPGGLRRVIIPWLDWFKPGFHPWDHDNREYLAEMDKLIGDVDGYEKHKVA